MKPYCIAPFVHLYQHSQSLDDRVCCISKINKADDNRDNGVDNNLQSKWENEYYQDIRKRMLEPGSDLPECAECIRLEKQGQTSDRLNFESRFKNQYIEFNTITGNQYNHPLDYDLRPGNLCNLGCRMCSPMSSTQLSKEYKKHKDDFNDLVPETFFTMEDGCDWDYKENLDWIKENLLSGKTNRIKFLGGEPTIMPGVLELLDFMIDNSLTRTSLSFTTNCTNENRHFVSKVSRFTDVYFHFSIDGIGRTLEYIRHPAKWNKINENIRKLSSNKSWIAPMCNTTIQAYNIHHLKDYVYWLKALNKIRHVELNTVIIDYPSHMSYKVLPVEYRNCYIVDLINDPIMQWDVIKQSNLRANLKTILEDKTVEGTDKFIEHTKAFDKVRNQNIKNYIPQLASYFGLSNGYQ